LTKSVENLSKRKVTGGVTVPGRGRRKHEKDGFALETVLGKQTSVKKRTRGGNYRVGLVRAEYANVVDPRSKSTKKVRITRVLSNQANRDYERRGVITKGAVIETEVGVARVTSRPSQDGVVNALLQQSE
jgi:small subunit ribosomal protein S8e